MFLQRANLTTLLTLSLLLASSGDFAWATNSFSYAVPTANRAGRFTGEVTIDRIGSMILPKGLASFSNDELTIRAVPQWLFDRNVVLKGAIIRAEGVQQNGNFTLAGLVLMQDGMWLSNLGKIDSESIDTMDGASASGRITGRSADALTFQNDNGKIESIPFEKIKSINSPRAFTFNISADTVKIDPADNSMSFDARQLTLRPRQLRRHLAWSHDHVPESNLKGTEAGISKRALGTFLWLDLISTIAPAISIPLVLNAKNQQAAKNEIAKVEFQSFSSSIQSSGSGGSAAASSGRSGGM